MLMLMTPTAAFLAAIHRLSHPDALIGDSSNSIQDPPRASIVGKACRIKQKTEILLVFQHYGVSDDDFVRQVTIEMARCESFKDRAV